MTQCRSDVGFVPPMGSVARRTPFGARSIAIKRGHLPGSARATQVESVDGTPVRGDRPGVGLTRLVPVSP